MDNKRGGITNDYGKTIPLLFYACHDFVRTSQKKISK